MKHILFTLKGCKKELLDDEEFVKEVIYMAAHKCRSTLISLDSYKFDPQGVTCVAMLAESHISIHTWPERGEAACDVFTCGDSDPKIGCEFIVENLRSQRHTLQYIER